VLSGLRDEQAKAALMDDFRPLKDSKIGEQAAEFRIIIGLTPADPKA